MGEPLMHPAAGPAPAGKAPLDSAPFTDWLGVERLQRANGHARLRLVLRPEMGNRRHVAHGGILSTLADSAMAQAARTIEGVEELGGTVDLGMQFLAPGTGELITDGWVVHHTRGLAFCRAEIRSAADGHFVATATATMRLRASR